MYDGRGKAFFFFNFEQLRFPLSNTRTRGILSPLAQQGIFQYAVGGARQQVNLLELAASERPDVDARSDDCRAAREDPRGAGTTGVMNDRTDPNTQDYLWQPESLRIDNSPGGGSTSTSRRAHRLSVSYNYQGQRLTPNLFGSDEPNFPGLANSGRALQRRQPRLGDAAIDVRHELVNELRVGISNAPVWFADSVDLDQFADQAGFNIGFPNVGTALTNATTNAAPSSRNGKSWNLDNTVNWLAATTRCSSASRSRAIERLDEGARRSCRSSTLGVDTTNDPANAMFTTDELPGRRHADLTNARALYALLTGRVTSIGSNVRLDGATGQYVYLGAGRTSEHQDEIGLFVQDSWRLRPNLTLNAGLRWQIAVPVPGRRQRVFDEHAGGPVRRLGSRRRARRPRLQPVQPRRVQRRRPRARSTSCTTAGSPGYETEYDNFAPERRRRLAAERAERLAARRSSAIPSRRRCARATASSYNSDGLGFYTGVYNANPGNTITTTRTATSAQFPLVPAGRDLAGAAARAGTARAVAGYSGRAGLPDGDQLQQRREHLPSELPDAVRPVVSRSACSGRSARLMAVEVRYVGTRLVDGTTTENWNESRTVHGTNGFLDEFKLAQENLQVAIAQGCGQPGGPRARSPTAARAPARSRCRSTWRTSTAARERSRATPRATRARTGRTRARLERARGAQSEPWRRGQYALRQRGLPRQHGHRPATRATSSC